MPEPAETKPDPQRALAAWYLLPGYRGLIHIFMSFGLILLFALLIMRGGDDVEANLRKSRVELLALQPAPLADADNALLDYKAASLGTARFKGEFNDSPEYFYSRSESAYFARADVQAYFQQNAATFQALFDGAAKKSCNWNLDYQKGYSLPMAHLGGSRSAARLLAGYARDCARRRDHAEAARAIGAMYGLARHVESDPILIGGLVSVAICAIADSALEAILLWETPTTEADVEAYRKALWSERHWRERVLKLMESEKTFALFSLDSVIAFSQNAGTPPAMAKMTLSSIGMPQIPTAAVLWYGADRRCCAAVMDEMIAEMRSGKLTSDVSMDSRLERHQTGPAFFANMMIPVLSRMEISFARSEEQARVALVALAWLQFRAKYKEDPESIDALVPEFLPSVPVDVFKGNKLRARRDPAGFREKAPAPSVARPAKSNVPPFTIHYPGVIRIYSLGQNGRDNQGYCEWQSENLPGDLGPREELDDSNFRLPPIPAKTNGSEGGK